MSEERMGPGACLYRGVAFGDMNEEQWEQFRKDYHIEPVDGRSEIARLEDEVGKLRETMYDLHNQEESYHSLIANAIEKVRYMVMNRQIEDLSTAELKKELKRRKKLSRGSV